MWISFSSKKFCNRVFAGHSMIIQAPFKARNLPYFPCLFQNLRFTILFHKSAYLVHQLIRQSIVRDDNGHTDDDDPVSILFVDFCSCSMKTILYFCPRLPRVLTVREMARLQSFPDDFIFEGPKSKQLVQIGNAVPPLLGKAIGLAVRYSAGDF